ncbi:MAG: Holliday junction branch migration DNA helicase RuvB [Sandaracinus sp.]|nr:Holliday junction branch migration DNA helicase RuvB [Sandaracinus sp.]
MTNETTRYDTTLSPEPTDEEAHYEISLRPKSFEDFVGQEKLKDNLRVMVEAAAKRGDPVDHVLFCGPPGLGKTTLAHILAEERGVELHSHSAPALEHKGQLGTLLTKVEPNDIIFIDEIHRLSPAIEEYLYTAVEDFQIEIVQGDGPYAQSFTLPLQPFTLVAATTRTGLLTNPMRTRFGYMARLDYYAPEELAQVVTRSARLLDLETAPEAAIEVARRARGTPRIANRLLRRARDFAQVRGNGKLDLATAQEALERLDVDEAGLDEMDRRYLRILIEHYDGGPTGVETLAAALSEPRDTLEDVYEPFLLQQGFIARTPRGRTVTRRAYEHLKLRTPKRLRRLVDDEDDQGHLF